jgi:hypothetical protein
VKKTTFGLLVLSALFLFGCGGMQAKTPVTFIPETAEIEPVIEKNAEKFKEPLFCESENILPIDCTEADKNSREIWFELENFRALNVSLKKANCSYDVIPSPKIKAMRNGNIIAYHKKSTYLKGDDVELLDLYAVPKNSLVAASGINGLKLNDIVIFEFTQRINHVRIKFARKNKKISNCRINFMGIMGGVLGKLKERRDYELAHADAVRSARKFGDIVAPILQERSRETIPPSISFDSIGPSKTIRTDSYQIFIRGKVADNDGVLTLLVNGQKASMNADGSFAAKLKLRIGENRIPVLAEDINGNVSKKIITIIREDYIPEETLADVDIPPKTKTKNPNGIAIVIGVENYQYVSDATYAYNDAEVFREYLAETMGFSKAKVKIITNSQASLAEFNKLLTPNGWLARNIDPGKSEIVIYFSGHGIPDPITKITGLLPFDVDPNYSIGFHLSQLYETLGGFNTKSVTVFLDACFTGENRERKMLLADVRGIVVVPMEKSIPNNLTVLSAASGGQFSGALKEKEHGLFTYYVLKGLGGDADSDKDKKLTMGELGEYVHGKVKERAAIEGREQTPELQGDLSQVLVQW